MIKSIKILIVTILASATIFMPTVLVSAQANIQQNLCGGVELKVGTCDPATGGGAAETSVNSLIKNVINIFSLIVGVISVLMIILGGFRYITSGGDSGKVSTAQQSIIYAIVGLVIVALAQIIVRFVLARAVAT